MAKKLAFIYNLNRGQFDYEAEFDSKETINKIEQVLKNDFEVKKIEAIKDFSWIQELNKYKPDLIFSVAEGFYGPARECVYPAIYEQLRYNYCGPDSSNMLLCQNKFLTKRLLHGIVETPSGFVISNETNLITNDVKYPMIVKLNSEGSSLGIDEKSIVYNLKDLKGRSKYLIEKYNKSVIVEKYIDGDDYSMAYIEGIGAVGPCQIKYQNKCNIYDYSMKTSKDSEVEIKPVSDDKEILKVLVNRIVETLDIKGYAKFDFRRSNDYGKYYLIEVNAQISIHPNGEFIMAALSDGYSFDSVVSHIARFALNNKNKTNSVGFKGECSGH